MPASRYLFLFVLLRCTSAMAQTTNVTLNVDKPLAEVQPTMWGIFFEDINFAADGGVYAELIKNRSFEFQQPLMGWKLEDSNKFSLNAGSGDVLIVNEGGGNIHNTHNTHYARTTVKGSQVAMTNEGFKGIGIRKGARYNFTVMARRPDGGTGTIGLELKTTAGKSLGVASVAVSGSEWKSYAASINATDTEMKATATLTVGGSGVTDVDMVSLFPHDTWKQRPQGLRHDLVQLLADLKPGFVRFPGGCIVEGFGLDTRYQWKKTVGPVADREVSINRWNSEFKHRPASDYFQSFGLGFYEYFLLAEDIGATPLPILNCGMACQFNSAEVVPLNELDPYVKDALDLVEFANGAVTTEWGKVRAQLGHPAPFNLRYFGVGNEQWGPQYIERYKIFAAAIHARYPEVKLVSSAGPAPSGELFTYAWDELKTMKADIVDEHYYQKPEWFFENSGRYDNYDRSGPKIFAGEYAAQSVNTVSPENKNNWQCALAEAAFMTGLERNADVVHMASYAPLFAHVEGWQWTPDLIWFDNLRAYGTPNYYVQKLFSTNRGTHTLGIVADGKPLEGAQKLYASAVVDKATGEVIVKVVNASNAAASVALALEGTSRFLPDVKATVLSSPALDDQNSADTPMFVAPREQVLKLAGKKMNLTLEPYSLSVFKLKKR